MEEQLSNYIRKCKLLKQIQSNKARFYKRINNIQNFITVAVSGFITFIGFAGVDDIQQYCKLLFPDLQTKTSDIQLVYNLLVFILFLIVIFHMVFRFNSKQVEAEKAITLLSTFINEISNQRGVSSLPAFGDELAQAIGYKYETIIQVIPPNTDREYLKAKKCLKKKERETHKTSENSLVTLDARNHEEYIIRLIENNDIVQQILTALSDQSESLYLGGGVIRNLVWDSLHKYSQLTQIEDVDVIYFDTSHSSKDDDVQIENQLKAIVPNLRWSVKNQARMHTVNNDTPYTSIEDAVSKWPETVSAMLLRKGKDGRYYFIAPFKYDDLFRLIVQPTPYFMNENKIDRYRKRMNSKKWNEIWPKIKILYLDKP